MRIAVLAEEHQKDLYRQKLSAPNIELIFVDSLRSLCMMDAAHHFDAQFEAEPARIKQLQILAQNSTVWISMVADTCAHLGNQFVRYNGWNTLFEKPVWEIAVVDETKKDSVKQLMAVLESNYQIVPDIIGMVTPRVIAMLVNEAFYTYEMEVSTQEEIDIAMKLGTNYPYGPFEWSQKIGLRLIYQLLNNLAKNDQRYTVSNALTEVIEGKTFKWK